MKLAFPTIVALKIPQMCTQVIFKDIENVRHSLHICGVYNTVHVRKRQEMQLSWKWGVNTMLYVNNWCG